MATVQVSIGPEGLMPDSTGNVYAIPFDQVTGIANDVWKQLVLLFDDTSTDLRAYGKFVVPQDYSGGGTFIPVWTSDNGVNTGNAVLAVSYRTVPGDDTTSLDQAGTEEDLTVTDAAPTTDNYRLTPSMAATAANFAAGETVEFKFGRNGTSGSDTMAARVILVDLIFQYTTA